MMKHVLTNVPILVKVTLKKMVSFTVISHAHIIRFGDQKISPVMKDASCPEMLIDYTMESAIVNLLVLMVYSGDLMIRNVLTIADAQDMVIILKRMFDFVMSHVWILLKYGNPISKNVLPYVNIPETVTCGKTESVIAMSLVHQGFSGDLMNKDVQLTVSSQDLLSSTEMVLIIVIILAQIQEIFGDLMIRDVIMSAIIQEMVIM